MPADRHEFEVVQPFAVRSAISDTERIFNPGEKVMCEEPGASPVMLKVGGAFFLVDRSVFTEHCKPAKSARKAA